MKNGKFGDSAKKKGHPKALISYYMKGSMNAPNVLWMSSFGRKTLLNG